MDTEIADRLTVIEGQLRVLSQHLGVSCPDFATASVSMTKGDDLTAELSALAHAGQKIQAIKLLRERTGMGLKEAKDVVDRL